MRNTSYLRSDDPWPDGVQPSMPIEGYTNIWTRAPSQTLHQRPVTQTEATEPVDLWRKLTCGDNNLARRV